MGANNALRRRGAVAAGHRLSAAAAAEVLRAGGSAVDAVIAGLWMACVCEPVLASPGGGGFLMALPAGARQAQMLDFFVHTPALRPDEASLDFHAVEADFGTMRQQFHVGAGASAVPGFVPGLFGAYEAFGRVPMRELAAPAIAAANEGVLISPFQAQLFSIIAPILTYSASARDLFAPDGELHGAGSTLRNPALGGAIEAIAHEGARIATHGEIACAMAASARSGGALGRADIARYQPRSRKPLCVQHADTELFLNPPPSCGGTLIAAMLEALLQAPASVNVHALADAMHQVDQAWRKADGDLARFNGSGPAGPVRGRGTTHISVVDADGFAVSATVSNGEGNGHLVAGCGFMLNNMLGEEDLNPAGFHRWPVDCRLSSMMAPTIMRASDGTVTALGSGGSNRIRTVLFQTAAWLLNEPSQRLEAIVARPRLHVEAGHMHFEDLFTQGEREALCSAFREHTAWAEPSMFFGGVHMVRHGRRNGFDAVGDLRRDGHCELV